MKTIYALVAACLSLQACNNEPIVSMSANEKSTANEYSAAMPLRDADYTAFVTAPTIQPLEDYSFDISGDFYVDEYNVGPAVTVDRQAKSYDDDYAMWTTLPTAEYWIDTTNGYDDYTAAVTAPAIRPIDGAEFEGTSRDDAHMPWSALPTIRELDDYAIDSSMDAEDHTATVTSPASKPENVVTAKPVWDDSVDGDGDFYVSDERFELDVTEKIDLHATQAKDW